MGLLNVEVWINFTPRGSRRLQTSRPPPPRIVSFLHPNSNVKRELGPDPELELGPKLELELDPDPELDLDPELELELDLENELELSNSN